MITVTDIAEKLQVNESTVRAFLARMGFSPVGFCRRASTGRQALAFEDKAFDISKEYFRTSGLKFEHKKVRLEQADERVKQEELFAAAPTESTDALKAIATSLAEISATLKELKTLAERGK